MALSLIISNPFNGQKVIDVTHPDLRVLTYTIILLQSAFVYSREAGY
jgi:hypothetical protein